MSRTRHAYGDDPSQYGDLFLPGDRTPRGVVVVIHGGFWKAQYDAESLGTPLATALAEEGWAAWNLEYRRVGTGPAGTGGRGGTPGTFDDVAAGIDHLAGLNLDLSRVVTLGHSACGHLATWAAGRGRHGWSERVPVTHVISQAGVLDLRAAHVGGLGAGAVEALLGHAPRPPTSATTLRSSCRWVSRSGASTATRTSTCHRASRRRTSTGCGAPVARRSW